VLKLLVTANVVPSSPILVTLIMVAIPSSETPVLTIAIRRNIPENGILHISYLGLALLSWSLDTVHDHVLTIPVSILENKILSLAAYGLYVSFPIM
jgi:hypothetical protein